MAKTGFGSKPFGHHDTNKNRPWKDALRKAICQHEDKDVLRRIANTVIAKALEGD